MDNFTVKHSSARFASFIFNVLKKYKKHLCQYFIKKTIYLKNPTNQDNANLQEILRALIN